MRKVDVQKLARLSKGAKSEEKVRVEKLLRESAAKDVAETKRIAKEILDKLPERLEEVATNGKHLLDVAEMIVSGKRDEHGWVVDFRECDAGEHPEKYLRGYLQVVYKACKKIKGLRTSFRHRHDYGDTDHCVLILVVSW